jgi:hypothetical protein
VPDVSQSSLLNTLESHVAVNPRVLPEPAEAGETRNAAASAATTTPVISVARRLDVLLIKVLLPLEVLGRGESSAS